MLPTYNKLEKLKITAYESVDSAVYQRAYSNITDLEAKAKTKNIEAITARSEATAASAKATQAAVNKSPTATDDKIKADAAEVKANNAENEKTEAENNLAKEKKAAPVQFSTKPLEKKEVGSFNAMFNPESLSLKYENLYGKNITSIDQFNSASDKLNYVCSSNEDLSLKLILDGTGVHEMGIQKGWAIMLIPGMWSMSNFTEPSKPVDKPSSVYSEVKRFITLAHTVNASSHEPNDLLVEWGTFSFWCRLASLDIKYTNFHRDGTPLRAELDIKLISNETYNYQTMKERKSSPDLTHTRIVKAGDSLPLLTREIYGSPHYYLWVAEQNGLDDIRNLIPGQRLVFPPLAPASGL